MKQNKKIGSYLEILCPNQDDMKFFKMRKRKYFSIDSNFVFSGK